MEDGAQGQRAWCTAAGHFLGLERCPYTEMDISGGVGWLRVRIHYLIDPPVPRKGPIVHDTVNLEGGAGQCEVCTGC